MRQTVDTAQGHGQGLLGLYRRFRKDEDGSLLYFGLLMFVLILWFGGMAVDLMRYETTRAKLQGSLDRATLAAADLDQTLPPADVVRDYMAKDNTLQYLQGEPDVQQGINYRVVSIDAAVNMPMFFYDLPRIFSSPFTPGMTALTVTGASSAEERVTDVEVSLVLDVSGSMARDSRIQNLRPAARDFVSTILGNNTNAPNGLITISMIPYSAVVSTGSDIAAILDANGNVNRTHNYSTCLKFDDDEFVTTALDLTESYDHIGHFDPDWESDADDYEPIKYPWCHVGDHNGIVPASTDEAALHTAINALEPYGNTAIDMGVKWGVALLDPSTQSIISSLAGAAGTGVPAIADGRPELFGQSDVLKVLVLMTDGDNTKQYDLYDRFKNNLSFIWFDLDYTGQPLQDVADYKFSVQYYGQRTPTDYTDDWFYWNRNSSSTRLQNYPMGFSDKWDYRNTRENMARVVNGVGEGVTYPNDVHQASWQELFATHVYNRINNLYLSRVYNDEKIPYSTGQAWTYDHPGPSYRIDLPDYRDTDVSIDYNVVNSSDADDRLSNLCAAARGQGIIIYTVAFEAPSAGRAALQDCASSPSHYFDVSGTDISEAFSAIASDIRALKLTR